jgi:hypothetical protein
MTYGRRRAATRLTQPGFAPHPGWRNFIAPGWRVLTDQAEALTVVDRLVDDQDWRADKRVAWTAILHQLVHAMDWQTGLVAAFTAERLGAAGARAPRTVSRVVAWACDVGLVVVVEHGASAEFLGTDRGRTPTYALVTNTPSPCPPGPSDPAPDTSAQLTMPVDESGDPPESLVGIKPLNGERLEPTATATQTWPVFGVPQTPSERNAASRCLLVRLGLDGRRVSRVPLWRARALLKPWWDAGACPAGLLWAIDHHPDRPGHHRGDAFRDARDPLRVIGHRLRPWRDRLGQLPAGLTGIRGDYRTASAPQPMTVAPDVVVVPPASSAARVRDAARAAVEEHLRRLRAARRGDDPDPSTA